MEPPEKWSFGRLIQVFRVNVRTISPSLRVIRYLNLLPSGLGAMATMINDKVNMLRCMYVFQGRKPDIVWHFDPFRSYHLFRTGSVRHIYHVIDPFYDKRLDKKLATRSDMVIVTSPRFIDYYNELNKNTILIQQGVDPALVDQFKVLPDSSSRQMVLLGSLTDKVNYGWIIEVVRRTGMKLLVIGPDLIRDRSVRDEFSSLCDMDQVEWTGPLSPNDYLPMLLPGNLGLIAYRTDLKDEQVMRSPLKVISYISRGMPVLTNIDCEIPELVGPAIDRVDTLEEFTASAMNYKAKGPSIDKKTVLSYLSSRRYDELIQTILQRLNP
jgi:glycosyltransferase involved in cell wall biosynthesis